MTASHAFADRVGMDQALKDLGGQQHRNLISNIYAASSSCIPAFEFVAERSVNY